MTSGRDRSLLSSIMLGHSMAESLTLFVNLIGRSLFVVHSFFEFIRDLFPLVNKIGFRDTPFSFDELNSTWNA